MFCISLLGYNQTTQIINVFSEVFFFGFIGFIDFQTNKSALTQKQPNFCTVTVLLVRFL